MIKIHNFVKISLYLKREKQMKDLSPSKNSYGNKYLFLLLSKYIRKLK